MGFFDWMKNREGQHRHSPIEKQRAELEKRVRRVERVVEAHRIAAEVERRPRPV